MGREAGSHAVGVRARTGESRAANRLRSAALTVSSAGHLPWALVVGFTAILIRLPLLFDKRPTLRPDSYGYLSVANELSVGLSRLSLVRPPGYPLLIAVADLVLPGSREQAVIIAQHLIGAGVAVGVLLVAWRLFGKAPAIVAAIIAVLSPQMLAIEHAVLSDFLFTVLVFAGIAALALAVQEEQPALRRLAVVGVLFGAATLVKPLGQVLVVVVPIVLILSLPRRRYALRASLAATLAMAAVVLPWIAHNFIRFDRAVISTIGDQALFWRAFDGPHALPFAGHDTQTRWVRRRYERAAAGGPPIGVWKLRGELVRRGYSPDAASRLPKKLAIRAIRASPGLYAEGTARYTQAFLLQAGPATDVVTRKQLVPVRERARASAPAPIGEGLSRVAFWAVGGGPTLLALWWILSFSATAGLLLLFSRDRATRAAAVAFVTGWVVMAGATALTGLPNFRYSVVGLPLLWITGSAGAVLVLRAGWRAVRRTDERLT